MLSNYHAQILNTCVVLMLLMLEVGGCVPSDEAASALLGDGDRDGWKVCPADVVADWCDCDDANPGNYPSAEEKCDKADNNCNNRVDEDLPVADYFKDADNDQYGAGAPYTGCSQPSGLVTLSGDCDDNDPGRSPSLAEVCDGQDNNCDTLVDIAFGQIVLQLSTQ